MSPKECISRRQRVADVTLRLSGGDRQGIVKGSRRDHPASMAPAQSQIATRDRRSDTTFQTAKLQTTEKTSARVLAAHGARVMRQACPSSNREGAGKTGYLLIPMARVQQNHRSSRISRPSLREWF
jgi:hypothetical protein